MVMDDERFLQRLLATFKVEAGEHVDAMSALLLALEKPAPPEQVPGLVETLFREAHSLKGASRAVDLKDVEAICRALESILAMLKGGTLALSAELLDLLYRAVDVLRQMLAAGGARDAASGYEQLLRALQDAERGERIVAGPESASLPTAPASGPVHPSAPMPSVPDSPASTTVRISTTKLSALLVQAEELLAFKFSSEHLAEDLRALHGELNAWRRSWHKTVIDARANMKVRRARDKRGQAVGGDGEASVNASINAAGNASDSARLLDAIERDEFFAKSLIDRFTQLQRVAGLEHRALSGMVDNLLENMKQTLMLPFATLLESFPKIVRDLARDSGKEADLHIDGAEVEIDRRILEQLKDPLIHLMRNAIDHGIETPAERERAGKPARGRIAIDITPKEGNKVEVVLRDDGRGIDLAHVRDAALKMGALAPEPGSVLGERQALELVFESGLSTSPILTDVSGRGLGLAIVREKVEKLNGNVAVEMPPAGGTCFRIVLPTTLATFRGLLVATCGRQFVLPSRNVERVSRVPLDVIKTVENRETIELDGEVLSLVRLGAVLKLGAATPAGIAYLPTVVLCGGGRRIAFAVDDVLGDQEVLVKGLGPQLRRVPNIAGATIIGAGRVVPILNVADLLKSALNIDAAPAMPEPEKEAPRRSLLVVEDSITSRSLLKNILETAGYDVAVAVDGIDALTTLRSGRFDLVVSDVEMPRMDGFDLTAKIRSDQRLAATPVVLVTALESRAHKERGIDVGANAYIVKSNFDQGSLLDTIRRLV
jgi:two-component system, chemotaxis family, sensor kinase CheA